MIRQATPPDLALRLGALPAPPPVVEPRRSRRAAPAVDRLVREASSEDLWPAPVPTFCYLAGAAGSGKTFATKAWAERDRGLLLCATTGIAAINLGGETINSILGFFDTASLQEKFLTGFLTARLGKLWKCGVRRLILDEVSMLAADQLTYLVKAIEELNGRGYVLGKWADTNWGGEEGTPPPEMGLTLVGDFLQLAPVKASYAFESPEWGRFAPYVHTLTDSRRQADPDFIAMLGAARRGDGGVVAEYFVSRGGLQQETDDRYDGPTIVAKNESVDRY
ncbi:MAG TPA: AAA family ATPase, partial [Acidimicrobiales bacterium]